MKKLSLQWRITLMTALLIGITCVSINLLLCSSGVYYMNTIADAWKGNSTSDQSGGAVVSFDPQLVAPSENLTMGRKRSSVRPTGILRRRSRS